jgi:hypothetical protein
MTPAEVRERIAELDRERERLDRMAGTLREHREAIQEQCPHEMEGLVLGYRLCSICGKVERYNGLAEK